VDRCEAVRVPVSMIKGHYRVTGASPDGDSVRFYPDDPAVWEHVGIAVKVNSTGGVQLRLDAIDALETHHTPPHAATPWRQPTGLGEGASAALLHLLGFTDVSRDDRGVVTSATPEQTRGYILTRFADTYGRAVAMAYLGGRRGRAADGSSIHLDVPELRRSVNWQLLDAGWVYPTFYSKLYVDLRNDLAATAETARDAGKGVWADDSTLPGFTLRSRTQLSDELVILPKLFRRLAEYLSLDETGKVSLAGLPAFLAAHDDRLFTVPAGQATSLDTLVQRRGQTLHLTLSPEQIVFQEN
jgi:endonuclease YncB( thermonuclease family)